MEGGPIAGMALQSITRVGGGQPSDQGIPGLLGEHAGGGDRQAVAVPRTIVC